MLSQITPLLLLSLLSSATAAPSLIARSSKAAKGAPHIDTSLHNPFPTAPQYLASGPPTIPAEYQTASGDLVRRAGWTRCTYDTGLSDVNGIQTVINNLQGNAGQPFAVNPQSWAVVNCDPGLHTAVTIWNANTNTVLQTDQGTIAGLLQTVKDQCWNMNGGSGFGGLVSADDNSWVVQVRTENHLCVEY